MKQALILSILFFCMHRAVGQSQPVAADSIPINKDSIEKELDEFLKIMQAGNAPQSYFLTAISAGNQQFSVKNVSLNAQQTNSQITFSSLLGYYHKSGLNILYNNYLTQINNSFTVLQHSVTGGYDYSKNKEIDFGFSYTRFIGKKEFVNTSSPYDNDFLAYINKSKGWFQPGVMIGFSTGRYRETARYLDSTRIFNTIPPSYIYFYVNDTSSIAVRDFSFIPNIQFDFQFKGFGKKDLIDFQPSVLFIAGANRYSIDAKGRRISAQYPRRGRSYSVSEKESSGFNLQSLGLSLDATWYIGKFYLNPQVYFDYYLLSSESKFSSLFSIQAGFMF